MGWSQQSAMAVEYPHGSPWVHGTRNSLRKSWLEIPFSMIFLANLHVGGFPRLLSTPTTVAVLAPGGRRRKALGSAKICGAAINCWLLGKSIAISCYQISNEYPMNIQWISNDHHCFLALIHMIHSHFAKYDDFLDPTNHLSGWEVATTYAWRVESKCLSTHCVYIVYLYICRCIYVYLVHSKSQ